jgi:CRISPR-associated endonuclease/helicase Cas3
MVVNTVERARHLHAAVRTLTRRRRGGPEPFLIHSLFRPPDREERNNRLALAHCVFQGEPLPALDDEAAAWVARVRDAGLVVIATQVMEAGVALSASTLFTELAPWPSLVQRFGRCNRFGEAPDASVFWIDLPTGGRKSLAPRYAADEVDAARTVLESADLDDVSPSRLEAYVQTLPDEARGALFPYAPTHVIRQHDLHGLFSTEPDLARGFTDISPFVRDRERDPHVYVAWRHFERTVPTADQPLVRREEICPVPVYELVAFLGNKGAAWEWDSEVGAWERRWPPEVRPGMLLLLHAAQGGYHRALGWTGRPADRPDVSEHLGIPSDSLRRDPLSHTDWVSLTDHLGDVEAEARRLVRDLGLDQTPEGNAVILAGKWHDIGKLHLGWQRPLREAAPPEHAGPWAKFNGIANFRPPVRHEAASALATWYTWRHGVDGWSALAVYLVAAHHGKVRTVLRSLEGGEDVFGIRPGETLPPLPGWLSTEQSLDLRPKAFGAIGEWEDASGTFTISMPSWVGMVAELLGPELPGAPSPSAAVPPHEPRSLGPFRLGFLEMVVRAADARASRRPGGGRQG